MPSPTTRIAVTRPLPAPALELLETLGQVWVGAGDGVMAELQAGVVGARALVATTMDRVDESVLDAAGEALTVVANVGVGYDNIDIDACVRRGVVVTNTPDVLTEATADTAMALILMTTRRLGEAERELREQRTWTPTLHHMLGAGIQGKRLGIVGFGRIGQATARRAAGFGMDVAFCSRRSISKNAGDMAATQVEFDEILERSDVVSLHCPLTDATHHLIGSAELSRMQPTAYLVNTARGPIVDEAALVDALIRGTIAGAGLDVFEHEPSLNEGLLALENVVLLPHIGSATVETRTAMALLAAENVKACLEGRPAITPVRLATSDSLGRSPRQ